MTERMKLLEAVLAAARVWCQAKARTDEMHYAMVGALAALDALPAQPPGGGAVGKVVQITAISGNNGVAACVFALRDDGSIWGKRVDRDGAKWWREDDIPATVTLEVTP